MSPGNHTSWSVRHPEPCCRPRKVLVPERIGHTQCQMEWKGPFWQSVSRCLLKRQPLFVDFFGFMFTGMTLHVLVCGLPITGLWCPVLVVVHTEPFPERTGSVCLWAQRSYIEYGNTYLYDLLKLCLVSLKRYCPFVIKYNKRKLAQQFWQF